MDFDLPAISAQPEPMPTPPPADTATPIADLSYRNYDGPLHSRVARWWIVAVATLRMVRKKPGFWILTALCLLPYLLNGFVIYFQHNLPKGAPRTFLPPVGEMYSRHFFVALSGNMNSLLLFCIALMVGAGSIAADTRANALMVYLSKPITKGDYLLGKWMGVFLTIFAASFLPALFLYLFCFFSYLSDGFLKEEPWLFLRMLVATAVPALIHASVLVGFSSWAKSPRMAGASYAGLYFVSGTIAGTILGQVFFRGDRPMRSLVEHFSLSGVIDGLAQNLYGVKAVGGIFDIIQSRGQQPTAIDPPALWFLLLLGGVMVTGGILAARARIRAVEVVKG